MQTFMKRLYSVIFLLGFLVVLFTGLASLQAGAFTFVKPITLPILPTFVKPKFRVGDWNSSGGQPLPYNPPYEFAYNCQIQISDQIRRKDAGSNEEYRLFAIAETTFTKGALSVHTSELQWFTTKYYDTARIKDSQERVPFSTKGHYVSLFLERGLSETDSANESDRVGLGLYLQQKINGLIVSDTAHEMFSRKDKSFETSVYLNIRDPKDAPVPSLMMRVLCEKEI